MKKWLIAALAVLLVAVCCVIAFKTVEYAAGDAYYESLRMERVSP